jgi:DNA-binding NtrC family response regulator
LTDRNPPSRPASPQHALDSLLVCRSAAIDHLRVVAARVAGGDARVLVTGESGVGKDVLARFVHARSRRWAQPFVVLSSIGLPEPVLTLALDRASVEARGGTLFFDEISEMPLKLQARVLRLLDGGLEPPDGEPWDHRVIASSSRDLGEMVANGQFREDLMHRLKVVHVHLPPLRERNEDVRPLAEWKSRVLGRPLSFSAEAWSALEHYYWPGNVRELTNLVEQLAWTTTYVPVRFDDLPESVRGYAAGGLKPVRERRRQVADEIYSGLIEGRYGFWADVYEMFMRRDLTRDDLRGVIRRGLTTTRGSYRSLLVLFGMAAGDYKRLLNFLAAHECALDFREFRTVRGEGREGRVRADPEGHARDGKL